MKHVETYGPPWLISGKRTHDITTAGECGPDTVPGMSYRSPRRRGRPTGCGAELAGGRHRLPPPGSGAGTVRSGSYPSRPPHTLAAAAIIGWLGLGPLAACTGRG